MLRDLITTAAEFVGPAFPLYCVGSSGAILGFIAGAVCSCSGRSSAEDKLAALRSAHAAKMAELDSAVDVLDEYSESVVALRAARDDIHARVLALQSDNATLEAVAESLVLRAGSAERLRIALERVAKAASIDRAREVAEYALQAEGSVA